MTNKKQLSAVLSANISHKDKEKIITISFELRQRNKKDKAKQNFINAF